MKKLLLTTALAAFLMKSCNRDRHDYEYIPEPPIEEPVCPPDCDCPECYTPEPVDPCAELEENLALAKQDSINAIYKVSGPLITAKTQPADIQGLWWETFDHVKTMGFPANNAVDTINLHGVTIIFLGIIHYDHPAVQSNMPNINKAQDAIEYFDGNIGGIINNINYKHGLLYTCIEESKTR